MKPSKEAYFTHASIAQKAIEMQRALEESIRKRPVLFTPMRSALLVLDMQAYFLDEGSHAFVPSATAILPRVNALSAGFSGMDLPVILTRHLNTAQDAGLMSAWWNELVTPEHAHSHLDPRLEGQNGITICKTRYDAFLGSPLEELLREKKVQQVVICGVMTHLCCESTARSAFMRGFEVFFTIDGTATYNEAFHRASLLNLAHGFATPVLVEDILDQMEENGHG